MRKTCTKCNIEKPTSEFSKMRASKDGLFNRCKDCQKEFYQANKVSILEKAKQRYKLNRDALIDYQKNYRKENKGSVRESMKKYRKENQEAIRESKKRYYELKRKDPLYRFKENLRIRTYKAFHVRGWSTTLGTDEIIGGLDEAIRHIESRFKDGMDWSNYGEWEADHILPLASAENEIELMCVCHYTNTQPLWHSENKAKKDKIIACRVEYKDEIVELV